MDRLVETIDIDRTPEEVFSYATEFSHYPEWQVGAASARRESDAPPAAGSKAVVTRQAGPRKLERTEELTEVDPPNRWTVRSEGSGLTAIAEGSIEPLDGGERSRVTLALRFEGHGMGKSLLPLVQRQARRQLPVNAQRLKEQLEGGASAQTP
jgi:uncharacterized protein YndB with AHSA1/START domain